LGGPGNDGWSTDSANPSKPGGDRIRFFTFKKERLVDLYGDGYPVYLDYYDTPIAYFSPYHWDAARQDWVITGYTNDCPSLGLQPYVNEDAFAWQLISAGGNKRFGKLGAVWTPATASKVYPSGSPGGDDLANFAPGWRLCRSR